QHCSSDDRQGGNSDAGERTRHGARLRSTRRPGCSWAPPRRFNQATAESSTRFPSRTDVRGRFLEPFRELVDMLGRVERADADADRHVEEGADLLVRVGNAASFGRWAETGDIDPTVAKR